MAQNSPQSDKIVIQKLKRITIISLIFMSVQIAGGLLADSIAILADAFHLLSDVLAYIISLQAVIMAKKPVTQRLSFGYQKIQPLGAFINVSIIWFVTFQLVLESTHRIIEKQTVRKPQYMLATAIFGLLCNLFMMKTLHADPGHHHHNCGHNHGHGHDHDHKHKNEQPQILTESSHQYEINRQNKSTIHQQTLQQKKFNNINIQAAYIHILSDIILSIGVILSAALIFIWADQDTEKWTYIQLADPFCTYFFSIIALYSTIPILKQSIIMLLDGCDNLQKVKYIKLQLLTKNYIQNYSLKLWSVNRQSYYAMLKVALKRQYLQQQYISQQLEQIFIKRQINSCIQLNLCSQQIMKKEN